MLKIILNRVEETITIAEYLSDGTHLHDVFVHVLKPDEPINLHAVKHEGENINLSLTSEIKQ